MYFKAEIDDKHIEVSSMGSITELVTCITVIVQELYTKMDKEAAKAFKTMYIQGAKDEIAFLSDEERAKKEKEMIEQKEGFEEKLKELFSGLKGVSDDDD